MKKKSVKSPKNWVKKVVFIALGLVAFLVGCGIYWKQTDPKSKLINKYGAKAVAAVEESYITTVVPEKLCERSWTKLAESSNDKNMTYQSILMRYYDLQAEIDGGHLFARPRELIYEYDVKVGPKTIERVKKFIETYRNPEESLEETYDKFCYNALWGAMDKVDEIRATYTTIPEINDILQKELDDAVATYKAKSATGIIMESKTGHIIAMGASGQVKPMDYVYEMGGQFKVFNTVLAYENGLADKQYTVNLPYVIRDKYGKELISIKDVPSTIKYYEQHNIQKLSADDIFLHSSNIGSAQIALELPDRTQAEFLHRVHLDEVLELDFATTAKPLLPRKWGPVEKATVAFGHGIAITPMHMIASLNAVVNEEYVYPKHRNTTEIKPVRVVSADIAKRIREDMHKRAELTTAGKDKVKDLGISSSTSEKRADGRPVVTTAFVAFPIDNPKYSMFILMDEPKGIKESAGLRTSTWNVIPTARKVIDQIKPILIK